MKYLVGALLLCGTQAVNIKSDPSWNSDDGYYGSVHYEDEGKTPHKTGYFVPNFGQDNDIKLTLQHAAEAEESLDHKWNPDPLGTKPKTHKKDYFVPNFGPDHDIINVAESIAGTEEKLEHKWKWKDYSVLDHLDNPVPPYQANVRALDSDILTTQKNTKDSEEKLGHVWKPEVV